MDYQDDIFFQAELSLMATIKRKTMVLFVTNLFQTSDLILSKLFVILFLTSGCIWRRQHSELGTNQLFE